MDGRVTPLTPGLVAVVAVVAIAPALAADTFEERELRRLRAQITQQGRRLTEQDEQIERMRYQVGAAVSAKAPPPSLATKLHAETVEAVQQVSEQTEQARIDAAVEASVLKAKLAEIKSKSDENARATSQQSPAIWATLAGTICTMIVTIAGFIYKDRADARHIKEIGFVRQKTEAVSTKLVELHDDLHGMFPDMRATDQPADPKEIAGGAGGGS